MLRLTSPYILLALFLLPGCRLWSVVDALPVGEQLSETMLEAMRQKLDEDHWQPNPEWSLFNVGFSETGDAEFRSQRRWIYRSRVLDEAINELDTAKPNLAHTAEENISRTETDGQNARDSGTPDQWDGLWPLSVEQVLNSLDDNEAESRDISTTSGLGTLYLKRLAQEDSKRGWNAAILLAQRDPQAARQFLPVLERIVVSYPKQKKSTTDTRSKYESTVGKTADMIDGGGDTATPHNESIESLIDRVAQHLRDDLNTDSKTSDSARDDSQENDESQQSKMLTKLLDRVKEASAAKTDAAERDDIESIPTAMRAAAAEAWCLVLASAGTNPQIQLAPAGRALERADLPNLIRGELYRAVARDIAPALIPRLSNAMRISEQGKRVPLGVRLAVIESCLIHAMVKRRAVFAADSRTGNEIPYDNSLWPETILNCRTDSNATVRRTFGRWIAITQYEDASTDAVSILESQLQDHQSRVRLEALKSLGWLGTPAARETLNRFAQKPEAIVRAAAIEGLSRWGTDELTTRVSDDSSIVRLAVTKKLAEHPSARSYFLLQQLLADSDLQVQAAAVQSIEEWPDDAALTLLLTSLRDSSGPTRRLAFEQLQKRRAVREAFSTYDSPRHEERIRAVDELGAKLDIPLHFSGQFAISNVAASQARDELFVQDVESLLQTVTAPANSTSSLQRSEAVQRLKQLRPEDALIVERYLQSHPERDAGFVLRELLPQLSPAHAALNALNGEDLQKKRQAAGQLRQLGAAGSLSPFVIRRLLPNLNGQQDLLVWRSAMAAVILDATEDHEQVALRALNDERADVRMLGIDFIQRHPRPLYSRWLQQLRLFGDDDKRVRLAAIAAASRCGNLSVVSDQSLGGELSENRTAVMSRLPGLRSFLTHADADTRVAAVISLSHLGDRQGMQELARLIWSPEPKTRLAAVRAMGETNSTWFIEPLIRHGWTERHVDVRRAILKSLNQLTLPGKRPADLLDEIGYDAKIKKWLEWLEENHGARQVESR